MKYIFLCRHQRERQLDVCHQRRLQCRMSRFTQLRLWSQSHDPTRGRYWPAWHSGAQATQSLRRRRSPWSGLSVDYWSWCSEQSQSSIVRHRRARWLIACRVVRRIRLVSLLHVFVASFTASSGDDPASTLSVVVSLPAETMKLTQRLISLAGASR